MLATRMRQAAANGSGGGIGDTLSGPTTIATSTAATATAYSNQRKVDRCQNGVLWVIRWVGDGSWVPHYSTDNGATWTADSSQNFVGINNSYTPNFSFFIDLDDYAHLVIKDRHDGYIYYRRGTPNAGRTAWTWSATTAVYSSANGAYPDLIAHREGTGWKAHIVWSDRSGGSNLYTLYRGVSITSGGAISVDGSDSIIGGVYSGASSEAFTSIDFNHTGDGKTVAGSTPHLYAAWSAGATGAGKGIRFKKATYSGGAWTWGTEREIDSTRYVEGVNYWLNCLFDGTRVVMLAQVYDGSAGRDVLIYERDVADTTTTPRSLLNDPASTEYLQYGSGTYDGDGNVYLLGRNADESAGSYDLVYRKWTRATTTLGSEVVIDAGVANPYVSAKRGYSNNRIEFVYTDGAASPYNVNYGSIR